MNSISSARVFFQVKYVYDWLKPAFASAAIIAGRVNASDEEDHARVDRAHLGDQPLPERQRLRVRVVDAEDPHAVRDPVEDDVAERRPEPLPVLAVEVDVVDVLVALRRVLRVLQRPVGPAVEPLRVLLQPRVVGRALDREVERDLEPELARRGDEAVEVLDRPELRVDRGVAAVLVADRPRAARVAPARPSARCSAPCGSSGRSGGSAGGRRRRSRASASSGSTSLDAREAAPRAREELVPGAEARDLAVAVDARASRTSCVASWRSVSVEASAVFTSSCEHLHQRRALLQLARRGRSARPRPCGAARRGTTRAGRPTPAP